jgi:hypothetical protein
MAKAKMFTLDGMVGRVADGPIYAAGISTLVLEAVNCDSEDFGYVNGIYIFAACGGGDIVGLQMRKDILKLVMVELCGGQDG